MRTEAAGSSRLTSLDGLRGAAAVAVLLNHCLAATSAPLADTYTTTPRPGGLAAVLANTPLRVLWAGNEAVMVFFVLSGLVLSLPVLRGRSFDVLAYFPARLIRLYLPVWGALAVAALLDVLFTNHVTSGATWFLKDADATATIGSAARDVLLWTSTGTPGLDRPLWSLHYEVLFSLVLPLALLVVGRDRRADAALAVLALVALVVAGDDPTLLRYMPMFLAGMLLAAHFDEVGAALRRGWAVVPVVAACALSARYWLPSAWPHLTTPVMVLGATALVASAVHAGWLSRLLRSRVAQWLGSRSFSLYLIHFPIIVAFALVIGDARPAGLFLPVAIVLALGGAELFFRVVEAPSHRLSRRAWRYVHERSAERAGQPLARGVGRAG